MKRLVLPLFVLPAIASLAFAGQEPEPAARTKTIAPYIDSSALAVAYVDLARLDLDAAFRQIAEISGVDAAQFTRLRERMNKWIESLTQTGAREFYTVFGTGFAPRPMFGLLEDSYLIVPLGPDVDVAELNELFGSNDQERTRVGAQLDSVYFAGRQPQLERLKQAQPPVRTGLAEAFQAAGDAAIQLIVLPTDDQRRVIAEMIPSLPPEVGAGSSAVLLDGLRWAALGLQTQPQLSIRLIVQSADADSADRLKDWIARAYQALGQQKGVRRYVPDYDAIMEGLTPKVETDRLVFDGEKVMQALLKPVAVSAFESKARATCSNQMRQLTLAVHLYSDSRNGTMPERASFDENGRPLLSWRVHLLPYLDAEDLYKQFHLDEPWDSSHNRKLIARMPEVFRCPKQKTAPGHTCYLVPVGKSTVFPSDRTPIKLGEVPDGTSNTIVFLDADDDHAVIWTRPDDLEIDLQNPLRGLVGHHPGGFNAAFLDGSTRFISESADPDIVAGMLTRDGGEITVLP